MPFMIDKTPNAQGGLKFDKEKPDFDLIEPEFEEGIARVLTYGAKKYAANNWQKIESRRYRSALRRHWSAYRKGERFDEETGESHLYHIACCLMFLDWFDRQSDVVPDLTPQIYPGLIPAQKYGTPSIVRDFEINDKDKYNMGMVKIDFKKEQPAAVIFASPENKGKINFKPRARSKPRGKRPYGDKRQAQR